MSSPILQTKGLTRLFIAQLYEFFFRQQRTVSAICGITFVVTITYALVNDFGLGRPRQSIFYESTILAIGSLLSIIVAYNVAAIRERRVPKEPQSYPNERTSEPDLRSLMQEGAKHLALSLGHELKT